MTGQVYIRANNRSMQARRLPFPRSDIHALLAPDLLHQLFKGPFKDHLAEWVCVYLEETHGSIRAKETLDDIAKR